MSISNYHKTIQNYYHQTTNYHETLCKLPRTTNKTMYKATLKYYSFMKLIDIKLFTQVYVTATSHR